MNPEHRMYEVAAQVATVSLGRLERAIYGRGQVGFPADLRRDAADEVQRVLVRALRRVAAREDEGLPL